MFHYSHAISLVAVRRSETQQVAEFPFEARPVFPVSRCPAVVHGRGSVPGDCLDVSQVIDARIKKGLLLGEVFFFPECSFSWCGPGAS